MSLSKTNTIERFQFHKGTIKTYSLRQNGGIFEKFQFHKGTIKTVLQDQQAELARQHFNSIKVRLKHKSLGLWLHKSKPFQFHKGTIKTLLKIVKMLHFIISIP